MGELRERGDHQKILGASHSWVTNHPPVLGSIPIGWDFIRRNIFIRNLNIPEGSKFRACGVRQTGGVEELSIYLGGGLPLLCLFDHLTTPVSM